MKKCAVFACPNRGVRLYLIDPGTEVWLCKECIDHAEQMVQSEAEKDPELVLAG